MPEEKTIHDLPIAEQVTSSDVFETEIPSQLMQSGFASRKVSLSELEEHILGDEQYSTGLPNFPAGSRTIFGALEYARQSGGGGGASVVQKTMAEYTALPSSEKMNGSIYKITDKALIYCLDEEYHALKEITSADYAQLTSAEKNNGTLYIITDEETTAADIPYSAGVSVADKIAGLKTTDIQAVKGSYSGIKGVYGGYISGSKNYFDFFIPCNTNGLTTITNVSFNSISVLTANGRTDNPFSSYSVDVTPMGLFVDCRYSSTQAASISGVVTFDGMAFTAN